MTTEKISAGDKTGRPQVKICGLTRPDEALACARMGADAIGLVFFPKSPRHLTTGQARDICRQLPPDVPAVAVCVDLPPAEILTLASDCGFSSVQLHGRETPQTVTRLAGAGLRVIKALFANRAPKMDAAARYTDAAAFLVECGQGRLPGGNAEVWDWQLPPALSQRQPVILAGGLDPANVRTALETGQPDAVDVSSGVEIAPGRKDLEKVRAFLEAVQGGPDQAPLLAARPLKKAF
jgi:phosphoribosylanthranilate isomerase